MKKYFVYIIICNNKRFYVGYTTDLDKRYKRHINTAGGKYTKDFKIEELVYTEEFNNKIDALNRERQLKGWSHKKKLALIHDDLEALKKMSISRESPRYRK